MNATKNQSIVLKWDQAWRGILHNECSNVVSKISRLKDQLFIGNFNKIWNRNS